ncbi:dihydropyrimidinase [Polyangium aurulentum]|uniref:dihydropyrimidinase n=1 Tax=Polyangium aurulentum TaxID=2567896 RepID=UPI0010AE2237|nr:dihydropyrimidinase [Polyangium aurulentum]UQA60235.1 dihydropyrimidinase [Polyangium aurulentum]
MGILIKNGEIITAADRFVGDVYCDGGKIVAVGTGLVKQGQDDVVIDASGQLVFPGGVDAHVHMELPFMGTESSDDFETGTAAGVAGGTTSIIDFVIPGRGQDLLDGLAMWKEKAKKAVADYAFHMAVTWWGDKTAREMEHCVREEGIPSFKTFMAYRGAIGVDDVELIQVMEKAKELGALVTAHCEHGDAVVALQQRFLREGKTTPRYHAESRPAPIEGEATARAIMLARMWGEPIYIVHLTCIEALDAVAEARRRGQVVLAETCPQYLLLDDSVYDKPDFEGAAYVMSPPIRPKGHQDALWAGLASGLIQTVATDHCPFHQVGQKDMGRDNFTKIPNGAAGIENRLGLLWTYGVLTGRIDANKFVDLFATQPAKIFGLYPRKGAILPGADADIVIFDPTATSTISAKTHHHRCDRNIFEGFEVKGKARYVIVNGRVQFNDGKLDVQRGAGRYLPRKLDKVSAPVRQ